MSYFNSEQNDHMKMLSQLSPDKICPCGWETKSWCGTVCSAENREKYGLTPAVTPGEKDPVDSRG